MLVSEKYLNNNKEKIKISKREYYLKNIDREKSKNKDKQIKSRSELQPGYIKFTLKKLGVSSAEIAANPAWITIQKTILKIKRKIKQNGNTNSTKKNFPQ